MMGKDERECVKLPFGEYLKVPDNMKILPQGRIFYANSLSMVSKR